MQEVEVDIFEELGKIVISAIKAVAAVPVYVLKAVIGHFKAKDYAVKPKTLPVPPKPSGEAISAKESLRRLSKAYQHTDELPESWFGKEEINEDIEFLKQLTKDYDKIRVPEVNAKIITKDTLPEESKYRTMTLREFLEEFERRKKNRK